MNDWVIKGEDLFAQGKVAEAAACFQAGVIQNPDDAQAWNDLAVANLTLGRDAEALKGFQQSIRSRSDYLDAHLNLADYYLKNEKWADAALTLENAIKALPENLPVLQRLALVYSKQGRIKEREKLLAGSRTIQLTRSLIDSLWSSINFWELAEGLTLKERLEGAVASCLTTIDGLATPHVHFKLLVEDGADQDPVVVEWLHDHFYYQQAESINVENIRECKGRVLEIGPHPDWEMFRPLLFHEIKYEGGCLGDFTHTKKIMRRETALRQYDLDATLDYFRENVGPCDCHVFKGSYQRGEGALFYEPSREDNPSVELSSPPPADKTCGCPLTRTS